MKFIALALLCMVAVAAATVHYTEEFDAGWEKRWVQSNADAASGAAGTFVGTPGKYFGDAEADSGVQTSADARFYKYSSKMPSVFNSKGKTLVFQYTVKNEQNLDCGGAYLKLSPPGIDQETLTGDTPYNIMFGPDKCGGTNRIHFIFSHGGKNFLWKKTVVPPSDQLTHLFTAIVKPDQTYEVRVDNEVKESGSILEDWDILPPKEINDPEASKPADWVDQREISDPEATKPEGWDSIPKEIVDPEASMPEDWDAELDGTWEAPTVPNPEYKGEWSAPRIPNPAYKGEWVHPQVANPEYKEDSSIGQYESEFLAFEIWQVKSGTIFDHILVADSVADAEAFFNDHFTAQQSAEKAAYEAQEKERQEKERQEQEQAKQDAEEDADDDDDEKAHHDEL
eukprot:TRINITY_DN347_c0_g1_i1.p1 TRINITY_DN347_c0_g1~~TRINITY_DN347_c0_g1_i1.p1  ORF type:complete len:418 (+),score=72.81 TRINITY_DN347_c0_g1_i1:66-1256(+)